MLKKLMLSALFVLVFSSQSSAGLYSGYSRDAIFAGMARSYIADA